MNALLKLLFSLAALFVFVQGDFETIRSLVIEKGLDPRQIVTLEGRIYFIGRTDESYDNAVSLCNDLSMVLVSIETEHEEQLLANYTTQNGFDMKSYATSGTQLYNRWFWSGAGQEFKYANWGADEPNYPGTLACVSMFISNYSSEIRDGACSENNFVICEQNANYCP